MKYSIKIQSVKSSATTGRLMRDGMTIVIAGRPNAGKSSLLNALSGVDSAIVTDIPGTTRDLLRESIQIDGMPLHLIDTAGLRDSGDQIEQEGIRRAMAEIEKADALLWVYDATQEVEHLSAANQQLPADIPIIFVRNKVDLLDTRTGVEHKPQGLQVALCAKSGDGVELLRQELKSIMHYQGSENAEFIARRRHLDAIDRAQSLVEQGREVLESERAGELLAEDLRLAQSALSEITGSFTSDDLLGEIFSSFCIGK